MASRLQYSLKTSKVGALGKVNFSNTQNSKTVVKTFTVDDKHYLLKRENLAHRIQMQTSQKQKPFSEFSFAFLKLVINFKHEQKKDDPHN